MLLILFVIGTLETKLQKLMLKWWLSNLLTALCECLKVSEVEHGKAFMGCALCARIKLWYFSVASECRTFLLYYLPILQGILPDKFLAHALLLSKAIRLLLSDCITPMDLEGAEHLLVLFWRLTEKYYGKQYSCVYHNPPPSPHCNNYYYVYLLGLVAH